jgi:hypothetical protein
MVNVEHNDVAIQISQLTHHVTSIDARMEKMEGKLDQLVLLDRTMAEINVRHETANAEKAAMWQRVDGLTAWKDNHVQNDNQEHSEIVKTLEANSKALLAACAAVESKVDGWINKGKGVIWTASLFLGLAQAFVIGAIVWTFGHVNTLEDKVIAIEYQISQHSANEVPPQIIPNKKR